MLFYDDINGRGNEKDEQILCLFHLMTTLNITLEDLKSLEERYRDHLMALLSAVDNSKIEGVVKRGGDINGVDFWGYSILHKAIKDSKIERVKILLDLGANVNLVTKCSHRTWTTTQRLKEMGYWHFMEMTRVLLENGLDIKGDYDFLEWAKERKFDNLVKLIEPLINN